jgi:hypothetical protein
VLPQLSPLILHAIAEPDATSNESIKAERSFLFIFVLARYKG